MGLSDPREAEPRGAHRVTTAPSGSEDGHDGVVPDSMLPLSTGGGAPRDEVLRIANLELRPGEYQLLADGKRVGLTVREFQTFLVLAERPDRVVTRPEIYSLVWGGQMAYRDRSVDVFVRKVRRKLETAAPGWVYIHTHFGVGYRFSPERVTARDGVRS
jgi:DNA-binding response OmpR family regulator